jgi:import receptor subunit TOM70
MSSAWSDLSGFLQRNRVAVIATAAVLTVGVSAGVYYSSQMATTMPTPKADTSSSAKHSSKTDADTTTTTGASKTKKKSKGKKTKSGAGNGTLQGFPLTRDGTGPLYPDIKDFSEVEQLEVSQRKELALKFKVAGNHYFSNKDFPKSIELYTSAIACDNTDPVFYSNRSACYSSLQQWDKVVEDTTKALELKQDYVKALSRRAVAYEHLEKFEDSILDYTCAAILTNFEDTAVAANVDRVLRLHAEKLVANDYSKRAKELPSPSFIVAFLHSFRSGVATPLSLESAEEGSGDYSLKLALDAVSRETKESFDQVMPLINKAIDNNASELALAYELRSTFKFFLNDLEGALADINKSIETDAKRPSAYIKRASVHLEHGAISSANQDFDAALRIDVDCADVYYHRAQAAFLTQDLDAAVRDYKRCLEIDPKFMFARIQLAVTQYRAGSSSVAIDEFRRLLKDFPDVSDAHNYYGEILIDQNQQDEALKELDKAIEIEKSRQGGKCVNVLPLVNKALAVFQFKGDADEAEKLCRKAVTLDPLSDVAWGTLGQLCLQRSKIEDALDCFLHNADIARTDPERIQALSLAAAAKTQLRIARELPAIKAHVEALTRARQRAA